MTKGKSYQARQTQKAREVIYVNTQINNKPEARKVNNTYENIDFSQPLNTAESPKPISNDSQLAVPVAIARSIRCLQVMCVALLFVSIIMAATLGSMISDLKARKEGTEGKSGLLTAEREKKRNELQQLKSQITQMSSGLNDLATIFKQMNDTIKSNSWSITQLKAEQNSVFQQQQNHSTRKTDIEGLLTAEREKKGNELQQLKSQITQMSSGLNDLATIFQQMNDTIKSNSWSITQLKAEQKSVFQKQQNHSTRKTDIEGLPMIGFTATGLKNRTNGVLIYKSILSQVGGGFNTSTGVFTCPVAGLYLVSMTLQVQHVGDIKCCLYRNRYKTGLEIYIDWFGEKSASQTAVLKLRQGDKLYIGSCSDDNICDETAFTLALIQADA